MKRIASALLLSLFLYNIIGYYVAYSVLNWQNRSHMSAQVKTANSLETIRIHKSEMKNVVFHDEGKEISYKGEMYDIKDKTIDGDYLVFQCINDKNEKKLLAKLNDHVKYNSDSNAPSEKKQNDFSKNPIKDLFFQQNHIAGISSVEIIFPFTTCHFISFIPPSLPLPPPEISFS